MHLPTCATHTSTAVPGDWLSPNPIPFLVVNAGVHFLLALIPRRPLPGTLDQAETWLTEALVWAGAGAKGAVGYGRFEKVDPLTTSWGKQYDDAKRAALLASMPPSDRWKLRIDSMTEADCLALLGTLLGNTFHPIEERETVIAILRDHPLAERWGHGKTQTPLNLSATLIKERAALIRPVPPPPPPRTPLDLLLDDLNNSNVIAVLRGVMTQTSLPKPSLQKLAQKARTLIGRRPASNKAQAVADFEKWVKARPD